MAALGLLDRRELPRTREQQVIREVLVPRVLRGRRELAEQGLLAIGEQLDRLVLRDVRGILESLDLQDAPGVLVR